MPDDAIYDPSRDGLPKGHYIHTREDGRLASTTTADIDALIANLKGRQKIVIHFHGGLVSEKSGTEGAKSLLPVYEDAGAYPIFFIWRSGLMNALLDNFREIAGEGVFKQLEKLVTKYVVGKLKGGGGKGLVGSAPFDMKVREELALKHTGKEPYAALPIPDDVDEVSPEELAEFDAMVAGSEQLKAEVKAITAEYLPETITTSKAGVAVREVRSYQSLMSPEVVEEIKTEADKPGRNIFGMLTVARLAAKVFVAVIRRFRNKTDHGVYPTVVEEILRAFYMANAGERLWSVMKNETKQTFEESIEVRGGRYFLNALADLVRSGERPEITLVGHSAGAVFVGNLLKHVEKMRSDPADPFPADFKFKNVIFLAPACTFADFKPVVDAHSDFFESFRMFTMFDANEADDELVSVLYPRSLLYLISGILEKDDDGRSAADRPIVGMERYYTRTDVYTQPEIEAVRKFVREKDAARVVWSPSSGGPGMSSGAISHRSFDEDEQVRASMKALISTG